MAILKELIKKVVPNYFLKWNRQRKLIQLREKNATLSTQEIFTAIYSNNSWGGDKGTFCSGSGSRLDVAGPYCECVKKFVSDNKINSVLDIGCGDFSVGKQLQMPNVKYIGVDIVASLIVRNAELFGSTSIEFQCLNAIDDQLPQADLVLVRQVLQHLSNDQIAKVVAKLSSYRYVMVTEHYPAPEVKIVPNLDKPHGGDTRIPDNSAVYLNQPPFNIQNLSIILEVLAPPLVHQGETIKTMVYSTKDQL